MHKSLSHLLVARGASRTVILRRLSRQRRRQTTRELTLHSQPWRVTTNQHHRYWHSQYHNYHRAFSTAAVAPDPNDDDDNDDLSLDEEIESLAASVLPWDDLDDHDYYDDEHTPESIRQLRQQRLRMEHSSLDLELGDTSMWDSPYGEEDDDDDYNLYDDDEQQEDAQDVHSATHNQTEAQQQSPSIGDHPLDFPEFPKGSPAAELHRQTKQHQPILSPLDMLERVVAGESPISPKQQQQSPNVDPLSYKGPVQQKKKNKQQQQQELRQLQLQLEVESQQEAVQKYRQLTQQTRSRKDYAGLNSLQKLILHWYQPVRDEIEATQRSYIFREQKKETSPSTSKKQKKKAGPTGIHRYGPLLNTVEPEKLAVILTHEVLTLSITKAQEKLNHTGGCSVAEMALKVGSAVEQEVLLQRALKQMMEQERQQQQAAELESQGSNEAVAAFAAETLDKSNANNNKKNDEAKPWSYAESRLNSYLQEGADKSNNNKAKGGRAAVAYAVRRARRSLNAEEWSVSDRVQVGAILLKILLEHATIRLPDGTVQPAFRMEKRWHRDGNKQQGGNSTGAVPRFKSTNFIMVHDALWKLAVADEFESIAAHTTRHKPMVVPPEPWTSPKQGGYAWLKTDLIRFHGSQLQREALDEADLTTVLDGLNSLSREPWVINKTILNVANQCWERNVPLGDIPSRTDLAVPLEPVPPERTTLASPEDPDYDEAHVQRQKKEWSQNFMAFKEARNRYRRILQKNRDLFSLRCSAQLKLGQAKQFQDYDNIYFPYNMDFRGRAYPVPPHLSNVGSDLCRGVLKFAKEKPLGKRGLFWLQVHLANLAGKDKMTFEDRAQWSMDNLDNIRKAVEDPLGDDMPDDSEEDGPWWMSLDDPFQGLATCHEIVNAIDSGNPETYMCSLPVHMDGSCNGLQHYAAIGKDVVGGTAVNLCDYSEPQDVYIGVMEEVIRRVAQEAERTLDYDLDDPELTKKQRKEFYHNKSAKLVNGLIDRGVVKRTVMTSVYGVTYIGARKQIQEKIEEKLEEQGRDLDEINYEVFAASGYLAHVTMEVIGDLFTGAKQTMNWLTRCARLLSGKGYPVAWMTPLGLPCIQPYRQKRTSKIVTALASVQIADFSDDLPIHKCRSVSAFSPNYIHSLDSTHMLMTALEMDRRGLSFSAVHDSFWTHPSDVDEMNEALRDQFVELYSQPLLEDLKASFELRYPDIDFPDLPEKGELDLEEVKKSKFFFQ